MVQYLLNDRQYLLQLFQRRCQQVNLVSSQLPVDWQELLILEAAKHQNEQITQMLVRQIQEDVVSNILHPLLAQRHQPSVLKMVFRQPLPINLDVL